jgi:ketosteroid isomerase-like protein
MSKLFFIFVLAVSVTGQFVGNRKSESKSRNEALTSLANAERAFSAETVKIGFRDGFIKYFADDGIGFGPHPEHTKEVLQKRPAPTVPRTVIFNWAPMFGDISAAGDLGYTTGPVLYTDVSANPKPPRHAMYFSVWQKQSDGSWKVVVDMGVSVPQAVASTDTGFTPAAKRDADSKKDRAKGSVLEYSEADAALSRTFETDGIVRAYEAYLDPEFRIHRNGQLPITTREAMREYFKSENRMPSFKTLGGKVAASNDLAFTYGSYSLSGASDVAGYYVHVWRKDSRAHWRLVADIVNELPKK